MELSKRQQQKEDTKNRIVLAAYQVFTQQGFTATTSDIAKAIGVSHGTIFVHFPTKNDLLICVLDDFGSRVCTRLHQLTENSQSISDVLNAHLDAIKEQEGFYTKFISEKNLLPTQVQNTFIAIQSTISFHLNKVVEKEIANNSLKELPAHIIFNTWMGLIHYYLQNNSIFAPNGSVIQRYQEELIESFLALIKK